MSGLVPALLLAASAAQPALAQPLIGHLALWWRRSRLRALLACGAARPRAPGTLFDAAAALLLALPVSAVAVLPAPRLGLALAFALVLAMLILYDLRWLRLPDRLTLPLAAIGLLDAALGGDLPGAALAGAVACLSLALLRLGYRAARGVEGLGLGDVKLAGALGAWLGLDWTGPALLAAAVLGILAHLAARFTTPDAAPEQPFGPSLALALWAGFLGREAGLAPPFL